MKELVVPSQWKSCHLLCETLYTQQPSCICSTKEVWQAHLLFAKSSGAPCI